MKNLSVLVKPASSLCNMRCSYCFYADVSARRRMPSSGIMRAETTRDLVRNVFADLADGDELTFVFQGGEPTLAGLDYFRHFIGQVSAQPVQARVSYALQTNGLLLDGAWCAFLKEHDFLVGLSVDGPGAYHDENRKDSGEQGTFQRVMAAKARMDQASVEYNVLTVLTAALASHPGEIWNFLLDNGIRFVQFIPCLEELDAGTPSPFALRPQHFASFYGRLFPLWRNAFMRDQYLSVKLFDDIVNLLAHGAVTACGLTGHCQAQFVIEADGSVYPCDFYAMDQYRLAI